MITSNARTAALLMAATLLGSAGLSSAQNYEDDKDVTTAAAKHTTEPRDVAAQLIPTAMPHQPKPVPATGSGDANDRSLLDEAGLHTDPADVELWWRSYAARRH